METYFDPELNQNPQVNYYIIDMQTGDVTGDGTPDEVYLLGTQPSSSLGPDFFDNITLGVIDGKTKKTTYLRFKFNAGTNPRMVLSDFTGDGAKDIFISIAENVPGGNYFYYLFSMIDNNPKSLFNFMQFNQDSIYSVIFKDYYEVQVTGTNTKKEYVLNIGFKGPEYLSKFYLANGKLINPVKGNVLPLGYLFPVDINDDGVMELMAFQKIVGNAPSDVLGYIQTLLSFNGTQFTPGLVLAAIPGKSTI
ncbi:hypothetical protein [Clostridium cylindrosporum]|uniref:Spore coat protein n=1 Tax=Clostridium cylindrosporum DSM 605 TaxID=1121307 RepID=A0A0J8DBR3_CLOCY|nr:hypothetical protein [Clostridium cylindrosporum]KMT23297.1 hypothetical protein CLCY_8c00330 [Clostridium cylindrosporum DSM 605]